jgi:hypothetical protein
VNAGARSRRSSWLFYGVLAVLLCALPISYYLFLDRGETAAVAPPPPPPAKDQELRIADLSGNVQIRRPGAEWTAATKGQPLQTSDAVRTADGSVAVLVSGEAYEVKMEPGTEVSVDQLTHSISRLLLQSGMASAKVTGRDKHTFEVKAAGSDATARTQQGTFSISNNGAGTVAVGTQEGEVQFLGSGKVVIVRAGQESIVRPGQAPSDPTPIPTSLLLKVQWPAVAELNKRRFVLTGQAEPGSHLQIMGKTVRVDANGHFSKELQFTEGKNPVTIENRSVGGPAREEKRDVYVDTTPPKVGVDPDIWTRKK